MKHNHNINEIIKMRIKFKLLLFSSHRIQSIDIKSIFLINIILHIFNVRKKRLFTIMKMFKKKYNQFEE